MSISVFKPPEFVVGLKGATIEQGSDYKISFAVSGM